MSDKPVIDWSVFDKYEPNEIYCVCGAMYHSHSKLVNWNGKLTHFTKQPCPGCGKDHGHTRRISSPPERWTLR